MIGCMAWLTHRVHSAPAAAKGKEFSFAPLETAKSSLRLEIRILSRSHTISFIRPHCHQKVMSTSETVQPKLFYRV